MRFDRNFERSGPTASRITIVISSVEMTTRTSIGSSAMRGATTSELADRHRVHPRHVGDDAVPQRPRRLGPIRQLEEVLHADGARDPLARHEVAGPLHQRCALRRPLPLAQVDAVDEPEHELVVATVGPGVQHAGAEAPVVLRPASR